MTRMNINILGLAEVRWTGAGVFQSGDHTMVYSGGNEHERGVRILLDAEHSKSLQGYWPVNERMLVVKLSGTPFDIHVIQIYAPTSEHSDDDIEQFYEELDCVKSNLKTQDVKIVMGDINAKVGNERIEDRWNW
ncbi:craniofacial development protein 2-like [Elysia marginata]|uniref:Craniofacial development protein 2-like n=1 Tax=Elysia marginata TaxID=1093978 RepID=A0AAV4J2M3_9GAST|nr:craniofacial development protein 2-like [Elysia marginata]